MGTIPNVNSASWNCSTFHASSRESGEGPTIFGAGGGGIGVIVVVDVDDELLAAGCANPPNPLVALVEVTGAPNGLLDGATDAPNGDEVVVLEDEDALNGAVLLAGVPKPDEDPPNVVAVELFVDVAPAKGLALPVVVPDEPPKGELEGASNAEDAGTAPPPNGEDVGVAAPAPKGEDVGFAPPPPNPPNGEAVDDAPPPNGEDDGAAVAPPKAVVEKAPNGLAAGVAGLPNGDADVAAVFPPNGLAAAPPPKVDPPPDPSIDGAPNAVVDPPPNGLATAPLNAVFPPPRNGLADGAAPPPNGDAARVAAPNGLAAAPPPNGFVAPPCTTETPDPGSGSPANSFCADWWFSRSDTIRCRWFCCSAASVCSFCVDCIQLPDVFSS